MKTLGLIVCAAAFASPAFCADVDTSKLPPAAKKDGVTYEKDIKPIFEQTCFRCHGSERQKGGLRLDSLEAVLKGGEDGKVVTPKDSAKSPLVIAVAQLDPDTAMPPKRGPGGPRKGPPGAPPGGQPPEAGARPGGPPPGGFAGPGGPGGPKGPGGPGGRGFGGPPPNPLTPEQVGLIRAWIDQGAK
jgi:hypothetical protein